MESVKKFEMVPASMLLDKSVISAINFHCGDDDGGDGQFGKYSDGLLWIGTVTDDDGKEIHGLHLATAEYPEEGSTTLVEFDAPATDLAEVERLTAERNALQLMLNNRDDLDEQLTSLEQRRYAEQQAREAAERRVEELAKAFEKFRDVVRGCERLASQYSPCIDAVDEGGGDDNDDPTLAIFHRLYYAMFDADAALNPTAEAVSHE